MVVNKQRQGHEKRYRWNRSNCSGSGKHVALSSFKIAAIAPISQGLLTHLALSEYGAVCLVENVI